MADSANPALRDAILWSVGLKKPTDGFLRRMAASLTVAEGEQLVQAHIRDCGAQVVHRKTNSKNTDEHWEKVPPTSFSVLQEGLGEDVHRVGSRAERPSAGSRVEWNADAWCDDAIYQGIFGRPHDEGRDAEAAHASAA